MSSLNEVKVSALLDGNNLFEIPEYQRGYRWRPEEVLTLISDISESTDGNGYFLNVLILQKNKDSYDIVDGQQRLTTLSILESICEKNNKTINELLNNSRSDSDKHFICMAGKAACKKLKKLTNEINFKGKLDNCRFFVYEIDGTKEEAAKVFERINTGKIPLSSAELLKASWVSGEKDRIKQKVRASRWQRVEELLQDDDFYFFICPNRERRRYQATRMDYVLELFFSINKEQSDYKKYFNTEYEKNPIFLYNKLTKDPAPKSDLFKEIENFVFDFLYSYCYLNITVRNYTGYLLYKKDSDNEFKVISDLNALYREKSVPGEKELQHLAQDILRKRKIEDLTKDQDDSIIHPLLLLSMVIRYTEKNLPFDFVRYASTNGWDIEHIHARNQENYNYKTVINLFIAAKNYRFFDGWKETEKFIKDNLSPYDPENENKHKIENFEKGIPDMKSHYQNGLDYLANLINTVVNTRINKAESSDNITKNDNGYYNILPPPPDEDWINKIGNLVLLPASINRKIGNGPYPLKCEAIKEASEKQTEYIPFFVEGKYDYDTQQQVEWTVDASNAYLQELKELFVLGEEKK